MLNFFTSTAKDAAPSNFIVRDSFVPNESINACMKGYPMSNLSRCNLATFESAIFMCHHYSYSHTTTYTPFRNFWAFIEDFNSRISSVMTHFIILSRDGLRTKALHIYLHQPESTCMPYFAKRVWFLASTWSIHCMVIALPLKTWLQQSKNYTSEPYSYEAKTSFSC